MPACVLCKNSDTLQYFKSKYHHFIECTNCGSVFRNPQQIPSLKAEKERYLEHNNDVEDVGYQNFVSPLVKAVTKSFPNKTKGLDFGAGTGPVAAKLLLEKGYKIVLYDPFFHPNEDVLKRSYDFIICCEVIEHFQNPLKEFKLLKKLLNPNGKLFCITSLLTEDVNFKKWRYKDDQTHVIFYNEKNLKWIKKEVAFSEMKIEENVIEFKR